MMRKLLIAFAIACATPALAVSEAGNWEGNFRRCDIMKSFPQGTVRIEAGETFDLDITWNDLWNDGATLDAPNILVQIGKTKLVAKANADGFGFELGPRNAIPPALFQAKHLQISVPDKPERSIDLGIGPGRKDLAFLKICAKFWACVAERDSPGNWPGKKKHCYYPRKLPT